MNQNLLPPNLRILIVEDEQAIATRYQSDLVNFGVESKGIIIVSCVEEAEKALASPPEPFDVMVLDIQLPVTPQDLQTVRKAEGELAELRKIIRSEENLRDGEDAKRLEIEKAYSKRPRFLKQIQQYRKHEAATEMIQRAGKAQLAKWPPIVAVTAWGEEGTATKIRGELSSHTHSYRYLVKPVSIERLAAAIHELIAAKP